MGWGVAFLLAPGNLGLAFNRKVYVINGVYH